MKLICSDVNLLKAPFEALSNVVTTVRMDVDSDGLRIDAIDSAHIMFVHLDVKPLLFDIYECSKPSKLVFQTDEFLKYLKRVSKDSILELTVDDPYLVLRAEGETNKTFKLKLLDEEDNTPSLPEIEYPMEVCLDTKLFKEIYQDIHPFSQKLAIANEGRTILFKGVSDFSDVCIQYVDADAPLPRENYSSIFDLDKIGNMLKADKFAHEASLRFGSDIPLLVELKDDEYRNLSFLLAPRIEEDGY